MGGGILWQKLYKWEKYDYGPQNNIGYFPKGITEKELRIKYPDYFDFELVNTEFGTVKVLARHMIFIEIVTSYNKDEYPEDGFKNAYYYRISD